MVPPSDLRKLDKKEFKQVVAEIFGGDDVEERSNDLFHAMDEDDDGTIEQAEFDAFFVANALSMGLQHESREKRQSAAGAAPESLVAHPWAEEETVLDAE